MSGYSNSTRAVTEIIGHSFIAMPVSVVCVLLGDSALALVLRGSGFGAARGAELWFGPLVWWPALLLGFFVNRVTHHRGACFVWIAGLMWLLFGVLNTVRFNYGGAPWMTRVGIDLFPLKPGECGASECLGVLFYTLPAVNAVVYSVGAWLGFLSNRKSRCGGEESTKNSTLGLS